MTASRCPLPAISQTASGCHAATSMRWRGRLKEASSAESAHSPAASKATITSFIQTTDSLARVAAKKRICATGG